MDVRRRLISFNNDEDTTGPIDTNNYLTILALEDGLTATLGKYSDCEYCIDGDGNWIHASDLKPINQGQTLSFRGHLIPRLYTGIGTFTINKKCNLEGNCMSLLFGDDAVNNNLSGKDYAFYGLFRECTTIVQVSESFLPATTLATSCYEYMFNGCTSLTTAPELPATVLAESCYEYMFYQCTSLTTAPSILPATTLARFCCASMFEGCTSLTTAPELPATVLAEYCYQHMFDGCTSLTTAPSILPATTLARFCCKYMFKNCTSLTTAPSILPATTLSEGCCYEMFYQCTSLTTAPKLPATTLATSCYECMFYGCTSLTTAPELPATTLATRCYDTMFNGCKKLNYIKMLATDISASKCLDYWVSNVSNTGTFVKKRAMKSLPTGNNGIPRGWTVQNVS